jgi:hypothetical protein
MKNKALFMCNFLLELLGIGASQSLNNSIMAVGCDAVIFSVLMNLPSESSFDALPEMSVVVFVVLSPRACGSGLSLNLFGFSLEVLPQVGV